MNLVEVFFSIITRKAIRRGSFTSVKELTAVIEAFIASYNTDCMPFTWTKPAEVIISKAREKRRTNLYKERDFNYAILAVEGSNRGRSTRMPGYFVGADRVVIADVTRRRVELHIEVAFLHGINVIVLEGPVRPGPGRVVGRVVGEQVGVAVVRASCQVVPVSGARIHVTELWDEIAGIGVPKTQNSEPEAPLALVVDFDGDPRSENVTVGRGPVLLVEPWVGVGGGWRRIEYGNSYGEHCQED